MPDLPEDIMSNFDITGNDSGWITGEILKNWVENQFVNEVKRLRNFYRKDEPALVLLDGHSSRNSIDLEFMWQQPVTITQFAFDTAVRQNMQWCL